MKSSTDTPEYKEGFSDGQLLSLAATDGMIEEIETLEARCALQADTIERMERDNARMADQLQRARTLAEQAGAQEGRFELRDAAPAQEKDGRLALFTILLVAVGTIFWVALARWGR